MKPIITTKPEVDTEEEKTKVIPCVECRCFPRVDRSTKNHIMLYCPCGCRMVEVDYLTEADAEAALELAKQKWNHENEFNKYIGG